MFNAAPLVASFEYAKFSEPEVRLKLVKAIKLLEEDLNDVGYDASVATKSALTELEALLDTLSEPRTTTTPEAEEDIENFIRESVDEVEGD